MILVASYSVDLWIWRLRILVDLLIKLLGKLACVILVESCSVDLWTWRLRILVDLLI